MVIIVGALLVIVGSSLASEQIPRTPLLGKNIPKYVDELPTFVGARVDGTKSLDYHDGRVSTVYSSWFSLHRSGGRCTSHEVSADRVFLSGRNLGQVAKGAQCGLQEEILPERFAFAEKALYKRILEEFGLPFKCLPGVPQVLQRA